MSEVFKDRTQFKSIEHMLRICVCAFVVVYVRMYVCLIKSGLCDLQTTASLLQLRLKMLGDMDDKKSKVY